MCLLAIVGGKVGSKQANRDKTAVLGLSSLNLLRLQETRDKIAILLSVTGVPLKTPLSKPAVAALSLSEIHTSQKDFSPCPGSWYSGVSSVAQNASAIAQVGAPLMNWAPRR
jgi:hypothetical protein